MASTSKRKHVYRRALYWELPYLAHSTQLLVFGYTGQALLSRSALPFLALVGSLYTLYLAFKVFTSNVALPGNTERMGSAEKPLTFWNGFLLQALNPKGLMVVLPITTVMFPAAHITGATIALVSMMIALGGAGAPGSYSLLGAMLGKRMTKVAYFNMFNRLMGMVLAVCAALMLRLPGSRLNAGNLHCQTSGQAGDRRPAKAFERLDKAS